MATQSVMIRNKEYDGTRLTLIGVESGVNHIFYSEASGTRYFINEIGNPTASMDSVTFKAHLTFTSSGTQSWNFNLVPMNTGETIIINTKVSALNHDGTKAYIMSAFGGYKHSGGTLSVVGSGFWYTSMNDFTGASASFTSSATASIRLITSGAVNQVIDWDIHIDYTKGYHSLSNISFASPGGGVPIDRHPWYPPPSYS